MCPFLSFFYVNLLYEFMINKHYYIWGELYYKNDIFVEPGFRIVRCLTDTKKLPVAVPQYSPSTYTSSSSFLCRPSPHLTGSYHCPSAPGSTQTTPLYGITTPGRVSNLSPFTPGSAGRSPGTSDRSSPVSSILSGSFSESFNFSSRVRQTVTGAYIITMQINYN